MVNKESLRHKGKGLGSLMGRKRAQWTKKSGLIHDIKDVDLKAWQSLTWRKRQYKRHRGKPARKQSTSGDLVQKRK